MSAISLLLHISYAVSPTPLRTCSLANLSFFFFFSRCCIQRPFPLPVLSPLTQLTRSSNGNFPFFTFFFWPHAKQPTSQMLLFVGEARGQSHARARQKPRDVASTQLFVHAPHDVSVLWRKRGQDEGGKVAGSHGGRGARGFLRLLSRRSSRVYR